MDSNAPVSSVAAETVLSSETIIDCDGVTGEADLSRLPKPDYDDFYEK